MRRGCNLSFSHYKPHLKAQIDLFLEQGQPRTAAAEKIKAGLKESPKGTRASPRAAEPWQPLPIKALLDGEVHGSKGTFILPVHRDRHEIEIPADGEKWPGLPSHENVAGDTLLAVGVDRYIPGGGWEEDPPAVDIFSLLLSHI